MTRKEGVEGWERCLEERKCRMVPMQDRPVGGYVGLPYATGEELPLSYNY